MSVSLYYIQIDRESRENLKFIQEHFSSYKYKKELNRLQTVVTELGISCKEAFQSKVPIDTGQLRNDGFDLRFYNNNLECEISVNDHIYFNSRKAKVQASALAILLDAGLAAKGRTLHRTQKSFSVAPYSSIGKGSETANWINSAVSAFAQVRRRIISGI